MGNLDKYIYIINALYRLEDGNPKLITEEPKEFKHAYVLVNQSNSRARYVDMMSGQVADMTITDMNWIFVNAQNVREIYQVTKSCCKEDFRDADFPMTPVIGSSKNFRKDLKIWISKFMHGEMTKPGLIDL